MADITTAMSSIRTVVSTFVILFAELNKYKERGKKKELQLRIEERKKKYERKRNIRMNVKEKRI